MNLALKTKIFLAKNNPEKIIEYLNDPQYDLDFYEQVYYIKSLKNKELVKKCLIDERLDFDMYMQRELLREYGDKELIKECLSDSTLNFDVESKAILIEVTKDTKLVSEFIFNEGKGEGKPHVEHLIASTENFEFIEECLMSEDVALTNRQKVVTIAKTDNEKFIEKCLKNDKLNFTNEDKVKLIRSLGKVDLVKEYIYDDSLGFTDAEKVEIISATENTKFIRECLEDERLGFDELNKMNLIIWSGIDELVKDALKDESLHFNFEQKLSLITSHGDKSFMRKCIKDKLLTFNEEEKRYLINSGNNIYLIDECIKNGDIKIEELSNIQKIEIDILNKRKKEIEKKYGQVGDNKLNLPPQMTIGMEIECEGIASEFLCEEFKYGDWITKGDGSLENGAEIISPILHPTSEAVQDIYTITNILNKSGQYISDKCGGHVHIGADYLTSVQSYINFLELYCNNEKALYAMANEKGEAPRNGIVKYALPVSPKIHDEIENNTIKYPSSLIQKVYDAMEAGTINIEDIKQLDEFARLLKKVQNSRYTGINFMNLGEKNNTIEFRLANGTINPEMWIKNANLFGGMVAVAEELAQIQKNGVRTEEDKHKLEIFEQLKTDIDEKEKVEILLELVGVEAEPYMERYEVNIGLIKENKEMDEVFIGKEPLDFKAAKDKFKGKESQEIESSARAQIEARDNILEGHERNLQNTREDRNYTH